ncbi:hypothetical protein ACRABS_004115 [Salmonella enterica subsp. enterica]
MTNKLTEGQLLFRLQDFYGAEKDALAIGDYMSGCRQAAHRAKLCWAAMIAAVPTKEGA